MKSGKYAFADMVAYSHIEKDADGNIIFRKPLNEHLLEVARVSRLYIQSLPLAAKEKAFLADVAYWTGIAHDLGKLTSYFQKYLLQDEDSGLAKNHSFISAIWGVFLLPRMLGLDEDILIEATLLVFAAILYHHGNLDTIKSWLQDIISYHDPVLKDTIDPQRLRVLDTLHRKQVPDLVRQAEGIDQQLQKLHPDFPGVQDFARAVREESSPLYRRLLLALNSLDDWMETGRCARMNQNLYLLFSVLIDADKRDAGKVAKHIARRDLPEQLVDAFVKEAPFQPADTQILNLRRQLFQTVDQAAKQVAGKDKIFTLTAPTGSGKTLSALNFALKWRKKIEKETGHPPRIIYALPFTSIIDQNHQVFENVLSRLPDFEQNASMYLLKHHHLADIEYKTETLPNERLPVDQALLLIESWESEIIVTTFIQLLHSLIGNRNRFLKKYHNIAGSILILDEVQNIPVEYWPLLRRVLQHCADNLRCTVILMTATQPLIFDSKEAVELVDQPEALFSGLDRIRFFADLDPVALDEFSEIFLDTVQPDKSYAVILNTIRSSIDFYRTIVEAAPEQEVFYLSTNIIPLHRQERIDRIRTKLEQGQQVILVSTQVIEAGVDLDFDIIYRDLAPVDSIVQAAGRANRHGRQQKGEIRVIHLQDAQQRTFAHWVYGKQHLAIAYELLKDVQEMNEKDFYRLVKENYQRLVQKSDLNPGKQIFRNWWEAGDFSALDDFRLIDYRGQYHDVFIAIDETAAEVWQQYQEQVLQERDFGERQRNYLLLRKALRQYILSVPQNLVKNHFWDYCHGQIDRLGYIDDSIWQQYYDPETGFKRSEEEDAMIL